MVMETIAISDSKYNLRWPDYYDNVLSSFRSLKADEDFVDVTLSCEEEQYSAHKVVLSACSPYFRKLLKNNPCQHPIIIMRDVPSADLRSLLNFMYHGEVQVHRTNVKSFLRTAEVLQVKGLADHPLLLEAASYQKSNSTSPICENPSQDEPEDYAPIHKRPRHTGPRPPIADSPPLPCRQSSPTRPPSSTTHSRHNGESRRQSWPRPVSPLDRRDRDRDHDSSSIKFLGSTSGGGLEGSGADKSLLSQALEKGEDSASDTSASDRPGSASMDNVKSETSGSVRDLESFHGAINPLFPPGLEALYRQAGFPNFLGLGQNGPGGPGMGMPTMPGPSTTHIGLQSHAANPTIGGLLSDLTAPVSVGGKLEMMRVRATDPRPCPKCGKIYRCVLCGTVAKSRNSLHSHMSRQHRGISTKDLPVLPMPAPFDPELASKLLSKAGVKVSPSELAARASPTAPRRSDLPKLDNSLSIHNQNQFPLPPSMPHGHLGFGRSNSDRDHRDLSDPEDLRYVHNWARAFQDNRLVSQHLAQAFRRVPSSTPYSSTPFSSPTSHSITSFPMIGGGLRPPVSGIGKDFPGPGLGGPGSALLDTYLAMISAAGEGNMAAAAAALNFQNNPAAARAAAMAMAASGLNFGALNGGKDGGIGVGSGYGSDREDGEGELGSDAENDDISEAGDPPVVIRPPSSTPGAQAGPAIGIAAGNSGD